MSELVVVTEARDAGGEGEGGGGGEATAAEGQVQQVAPVASWKHGAEVFPSQEYYVHHEDDGAGNTKTAMAETAEATLTKAPSTVSLVTTLNMIA